MRDIYSKIIGFYNQNGKKIIRTILLLASIWIIVQFLNEGTKERKEKENQKTDNVISNTVYINKQEDSKNEKTVDEFLEYCNNQNITEAYNMLSTECKEYEYNTIKEFENNYYNIIFTEIRDFTKEAYAYKDNIATYKITYIDDLLANGKENPDNNIEDYITVIEEDGQPKLNISKFIKTEYLDKTYEDEDVKINIESKIVYIDSEKYLITIENKSDSDINLNIVDEVIGCYLKDGNDKEYIAKYDKEDIKLYSIDSKETKDIKLEFEKNYKDQSKIQTINFNQIFISKVKDVIEINL